MKQKQSVLSIKDKQMIIWRLEEGEEGTNLALKFKITVQEISDIHKNKEKIPNSHAVLRWARDWNESPWRKTRTILTVLTLSKQFSFDEWWT